MAKAKNKAAKPAQKTGHAAPVFWILVFTGLGIVLFPPTMLVLLSGMIPSIIAALMNTSRIGGNLPAMIALNLAGVVPVVGILWERGHNFNQAFVLLSDVYMWLPMFGGAGIAAFLSWGVPVCIYAAYEVQANSAAKRLLKQRGKLAQEWGGQLIQDANARTGAT